jgi:hypothetical protein
MCNRCNNEFVIHNLNELNRYLKLYHYRKGILDLWFTRGHFTNLIYLEYLEQQYEKKLEI